MDIKNVSLTDKVQNEALAQSQKAKKAVSGEALEQNKIAQETSSATNQEKVQWSAESQMRAEGLDIAKNAPDLRSDKVAALKAAIQSGNYRVDSKTLADKMIQTSLEDDLLASVKS